MAPQVPQRAAGPDSHRWAALGLRAAARGRVAGVDPRCGGRGGLALRKQGERGAWRCQLLGSRSLSWVVTGVSPKQEELGRREEPGAPPTLLPVSLGLLPGRG